MKKLACIISILFIMFFAGCVKDITVDTKDITGRYMSEDSEGEYIELKADKTYIMYYGTGTSKGKYTTYEETDQTTKYTMVKLGSGNGFGEGKFVVVSDTLVGAAGYKYKKINN